MKVAVTFKDLDDDNRRKIAPYDAALRGVGLDPVHITPAERGGLSSARGLVLTGGSDINPSLYGEKMAGSEQVDEARDQLEMDCLREALELDLPVLAICRGLQLLNVFHGGSLVQDLGTSAMHQQRCPVAHSVNVVAGTKLSGIIGAGKYDVNSRHHQAAGRVGAELIVSARSIEDEVIEGLERPDRTFVVGVQWHPEDRVLVSAADRRIFEAFRRAIWGHLSIGHVKE